MNYRVDKGTELFDQLKALNVRMHEVSEEARKVVKELGGKRHIIRGDIAGGVRGIEYDEQPKNWKRIHNNFYFPKEIKSNKDLIGRLRALPLVEDTDLNKLVNFTPVFSVGYIITRPRVIWRDDYILLYFGSVVDYTPVEGMVEILASEYKRLSE